MLNDNDQGKLVRQIQRAENALRQIIVNVGGCETDGVCDRSRSLSAKCPWCVARIALEYGPCPGAAHEWREGEYYDPDGNAYSQRCVRCGALKAAP